MTSESRKVQNIPSGLLTAEENNKVFSSLGKQCTTLATTVVQLYLSEAPLHSLWVKKYCGVICFVKDCPRRSYFFRLFDIDKSVWVWEQEMYAPFKYKTTCPFFHTFEADTCMAGFNFADNDEAFTFETAVIKKIQLREERKSRRRAQNASLQPTSTGIIAAQPKYSQYQVNGKEEKRHKKKKKLTKEDISQPTNFTHLHHVGWDPEKGFAIENAEKELETFFSLVGVSDRDLNDCETRTFIYDFIATHGGVERVKQETQLTKSAPPPVPVRDVPQTPRSAARSGAASRTAAPSPPSHPPPAVPVSKQPFNSTVPPPPPPPPPPSKATGGVPPPPPPPPPVPSACTVQSGGNAPMDNRSALLDQIRKGKDLHHVEINGNAVEAPADNPRGALLNQIRQGIVLKSVPSEPKSTPAAAAPLDGLAGALARALHERNRAIQQTDESDSSSEDTDGEDWD